MNSKANQLSSAIAYLRAMNLTLNNGGLDEVLTAVGFIPERAEASANLLAAQAKADKKAA